MAGYNKGGVRAAVASPVKSTGTTALTFGGGQGYLRDEKSELFLAAVSSMAGEDSFYETGGARDDRITRLVARIAVADPDWLLRFIPWLRNEANMRTAPVMIACEAVHARLEAVKAEDDRAMHTSFNDVGVNRQFIDLACSRADEPGEIMAYWTTHFGRAIPKPVKRGLADAVARLYNERSLVKYDSESNGYRFGDVLDLAHPTADPAKPWQGDLYRYAIHRRHGRDEQVPDSLQTLRYRQELLKLPVAERRALLLTPEGPSALFRAGMTWEAVSGWLQGPMDHRAWEAVIPSMGYMALLRNLRNFDQNRISDKVADIVAEKLADPNEVARSRQLPMRFLSAYRAAKGSERWNNALRKALDCSLRNIPELGGRTLIMVDTSGSMDDAFSAGRGRTVHGMYVRPLYAQAAPDQLKRWDAATMFGLALARRCREAEVVSFSDRVVPFPQQPGESLLYALERWRTGGYFQGRGTQTIPALISSFKKHDRVVILTDEQAFMHPQTLASVVPNSTMVYTYNLAGYRVGHGPSGDGNLHTFGGLTDACFKQIPLLEAGRNASWPF